MICEASRIIKEDLTIIFYFFIWIWLVQFRLSKRYILSLISLLLLNPICKTIKISVALGDFFKILIEFKFRCYFYIY